jgi:hypothetical protein
MRRVVLICCKLRVAEVLGLILDDHFFEEVFVTLLQPFLAHSLTHIVFCI